MNKDDIRTLAQSLYETVDGNILTEDMDVIPVYYGLRLFDEPIVGFGSAGDPLFEEYKKPGVIGPWHMSPEEWLPGAKTVISVFFPASAEVRASNVRENVLASKPWQYARIEGQRFIARYIS